MGAERHPLHGRHGTVIDATPVDFPECRKVRVWFDWESGPELYPIGSLVAVDRPAPLSHRWAVYQSATIPTMGSCENRVSPLFPSKEEAAEWLSKNFVPTGHQGMGSLGRPTIRQESE